MVNKSILIIGAGFGQIPAINKAKELGLIVVCIDRNPNAVGMSLADYSYPVDVTDFYGALKIAKKHQVGAVFTMQSDLPVPTIGFINDQLSLRGVSLEVANACSDKVQTRKRLAKFNCAQPLFEVITKFEEVEAAVKIIGLPCVIKAPDSSGSRGVVKVKSIDQLYNAYEEAKNYSRSGEIIVEEFIEGLEFGAQTFSINGKCELVLLHNDTISPPPYMIPIGHSFPFNQLDELDRITAINDIKAAVNALGLNDGPANVDLILDKKSNKIKIIEIGARIGATCLPELVDYHIGKSWVEMSIKNLLGFELDLSLDVAQFRPIAAQIIQSPKDGVFLSYKFQTTKKSLVDFEITVNEGDKVNILRKGTDRIGKVLASGVSAEDCELNCEEFIDEIVINVK
jgi:biotin carboxylase